MARRQKYKFAKKQYAKNGEYSAMIAAVSVFLLIFSVLLSFALGGQAGVFVGGLGLMSMLFAIYGLVLGVRGYSEKKCSHKYCAIGTIANGVICILYLVMVMAGAR